jgi:hypothetical protein
MDAWAVAPAFLLLAAAAVASPHIAVETPVFDFGTIANGSEVLHDFVVRNTGDSDLEVQRIVSSCNACLQADIELNTIPPGKSCLLHSALDLREMDGPVSREIVLHSNDPDSESTTVELRGVVIPYYQLAPTQVNIDMSQGQNEGATEIVPLLALRAPLSKVSTGDRRVAALVTQEGNDRYQLSVKAVEALPQGNTMIGLTVQSTDPGDPPCRVSVLIHNPPDLELIPEKLRFEALSEPQVRILWVKQHGSSPLELIDVVPSSDAFRAEVNPDMNGLDYRIYVTALGRPKAGSRKMALTLKLRDQNRVLRNVEVPITIDAPGGGR